MLQNNYVVTDSLNRELKPHGTPAFQCAGYETLYSLHNGYVLLWHWHEEFELTYVTRGTLNLQTSSGVYELKKGDMAFINSNVLHSARGDCLLNTFVFHPYFISGGKDTAVYEKYVSPIEKCSSLPCLVIPDLPKELLKGYRSAFEALRNDSFGYELTVRESLEKILLHIYESNREIIESPQDDKNPDTSRIGEMLTYLHENYRSEITISDLAAAAGISGREAQRCFRRVIGEPPVQYLIKYRLQQSVNMMALSPELTISEIAERSGFPSPAYYTKKFREVYGVTPKEYRVREVEERNRELYITGGDNE